MTNIKIDYLLQLQFVIIASIITFILCVVLKIKCNIKKVFIVIILFTIINAIYTLYMYRDLLFLNKLSNVKKQNPSPNTHATYITETNSLNKILTNPQSSVNTGANIVQSSNSDSNSDSDRDINNGIGVGFAREKDLNSLKFSVFNRKTNTGDIDGTTPPFDNLDPKELLTRLNYIYYATANPYQKISYINYKTDADKHMDKDKSSLSGGDQFHLKYTAKYYPQMSTNQIDTRDCLNEGSGVDSCFQTPQLFANLNSQSQSKTVEGFTSSTTQATSILSQGLNNINSLFLKDDKNINNMYSKVNDKSKTQENFSNPMVLDEDTRYLPIMFRNAPGHQDQLIDAKSNEHIKLEDDSTKLCRNCKVAVCEDDYCRWQNKLFI